MSIATQTKPIANRMIGRDVAGVKVQRRTDDDGTDKINGYAAVFYDGTPETEYELWSGTKERIMPGAFDRALKEKDDTRALFNHDANHLLGRTTAGTLRLDVDKKGLHYEIDLPDTATARDLVELIDRGDLSGSSFAFVVTDEEWKKEDEERVRDITGVRLYDVSPVTYPAYEGTSADRRATGDLAEVELSLYAWEKAQARKAEEIDMDLRIAELEQ